MSTKLVFDTSALISLSLAENLHLLDKLGSKAIVPPMVFSELKETSAYARGWKQSVIYGTAILMMEKAREAKGEK